MSGPPITPGYAGQAPQAPQIPQSHPVPPAPSAPAYQPPNFMQLLQQSPYFSAVQNSPYVTPFQFPAVPNTWGQMARGAFNSPLPSEVQAQQQAAKNQALTQMVFGAPRPYGGQQRN